MLTLTYQNDVRKILALVLSTLKISPLPPEMTWLTSRKFHSALCRNLPEIYHKTMMGQKHEPDNL